MEKEDNYPAAAMAPPSLGEFDYSTATTSHHHHHHQQMITMASAITIDAPSTAMADYMLNNPSYGSAFTGFADVMQFADFGPKLALHAHHGDDGDAHAMVDPVYMLKFPVLNDHHHHHGKAHDDEDISSDQLHPSQHHHDQHQYYPDQSRQEENASEPVVQLEFLGAGGSLNQMMMLNTANATCSDQVPNPNNNNNGNKSNNGNKRKRARTLKTSEEVESQRMTHIAVERNRRKQMNEHLRVLRSLMPSSYVQRGDQASIIGGAIEFVRELEQLLQCLESQKRRRLYGEATPCGGGGGTGVVPLPLPLPNTEPFGPSNDPSHGVHDHPAGASKLVDMDSVMMMAPSAGPAAGLGGLREETAENKSSIADVEVKLLGFDAFVKILSRRRPGQLIKAISALQDLQFTILHTNITTIEQTVLYSFNVKICSDTRFSAEDIASSVQQIFTFIHANTAM